MNNPQEEKVIQEEKSVREIPFFFKKELTNLLNTYNMENASNTPDFMLSRFLTSCLEAFETATHDRETWNEKTSQSLKDIDGLLLCSECGNRLKVEVFSEEFGFFKVYPCTHCENKDHSMKEPKEEQPMKEPKKQHFYNFTFQDCERTLTITTVVLMFDKKDLTLSCIAKARKAASVSDEAVLLSFSYFGYMTLEEFKRKDVQILIQQPKEEQSLNDKNPIFEEKEDEL